MKVTPRRMSRNTGISPGSSDRKPLSDVSVKKRNRKNAMLSSDSDGESEPCSKKLKVEVIEQQKLETPKRNISKGRLTKLRNDNALEAKKDPRDISNNYEKQELAVNIKEEPTDISKEFVKEQLEEKIAIKEEEIPSPYVGLSEYEIQIQKNIEARAKFMNALDIFTAKENLMELSPKTPKPARKESRGIARAPKSPPLPQERRKSLRQRNMTPDGANLVLPSEKLVAQADSHYVEDRPRPPAGPAPLMDYYEKDGKDECRQLIADISKISNNKGKDSVWSGSLTSVLKVLKEMKINDSLVAKVTPQRTFSLQVHPSEDKTLLLMGAKWGELGVWDVERKDSTDGAYYFNVHSRPINCLTIQNSKPEHVYTTSYDGSVRRTDLSCGVVEEVYSYCNPEDGRRWIAWHAHQDESTLLVAGNGGDVVLCDLRDDQRTSKKYYVHDKSVKVVTVHPTHNHYFATSSLSCVRLWDMRHHKKNNPISEVIHGKVVSGLEFSPLSGTRLVSTCGDDNLRIISCDLTKLSVVKKFHHNNYTGRWLTTFKARFLPHREDLIMVGSLNQPRRIEVFDVEGRLMHNLMGESFGSVTSITAVHPTLPVVAGVNSSGKAFVFKTNV